MSSAHRAGQAGGGWEDEDHLEEDEGGSSGGSSSYSFKERSYSFRDTPNLPPLGIPHGSANPHGGAPQEGLPTTLAERLEETHLQSGEDTEKLNCTTRDRSSSSLRETEFLREFLNVCSTWPVPYDTFMELCKQCSLFDAKDILHKIAVLFYQELPRSQSNNNISIVVGDGDSTSDSVPCHQPPPPQSTTLPHHHQMALLTLVDLNVHDDVFSPIHVRDALSFVLELLQKDLKAADVVRTRAKRLALVTDKLAQVCERRDA